MLGQLDLFDTQDISQDDVIFFDREFIEIDEKRYRKVCNSGKTTILHHWNGQFNEGYIFSEVTQSITERWF